MSESAVSTSSVVVTDTALNEFCRFAGLPPGESAMLALRRELASAKFVKIRNGAELWRGRRPHRFQFIIFAQGGAQTLAGVYPQYCGFRAEPVVREMVVRTDSGLAVYKALDVIYEPGFERRVAFKTTSPLLEKGHRWLTGRRGETLDVIIGELQESDDPPGWALPYLHGEVDV